MLLETHTLLWFLDNDIKLPPNLKSLIEAKPRVYVSIVSLWEIAIKPNINKLGLNYAFVDLESLLKELNIEVLHITFQVLEAYRNLLLHHRDPFDRMIISQAQCHNLPAISKDENFKKYDINLLWEWEQ